jgi:hypothetical protein
MPHFRTPLRAALGAVALALTIPLLAASPAAAVVDPDAKSILVFSKAGFTDPAEEDAAIAAELETLGGVVTIFDGGDGSAEAWTAALSGVDTLVIPEGNVYQPAGTAVISTGAAAVIKDWLAAGGTALGTGSYTHRPLVEYFTGLDYSTGWGASAAAGGWLLQLESDTLPASLPIGNMTGGQGNYGIWGAPQKAAITPIYLSADGQNLGVGAFNVGEGEYLYYAYDWYPDAGELTNGVRAAWNEALLLGAAGSFTPEPEPEPEPDPAPAPEPEPAPEDPFLALELKISEGSPVEGGQAAFTAAGLEAGASYTLVLRSDPIVLASGSVPGSGIVAQDVTIPDGLEPGWHSLTFTSTYADGSEAESVLWFEVAADGTLVQTRTTAPAQLAETGFEAAPAAAAALLALLTGGLLLARRGTRAER